VGVCFNGSQKMAEQPKTQGFEQFITNLPSAQSLKSLPNKGFCLYDGTEYFEPVSENGMLLPIRATEPRKVNIVRVSGASGYNFYESLSGIETRHRRRRRRSQRLQFLRIPIRD
jgi:hypothetical protein